MAEIVVADAGPLIALGRLRKLELLAGVFEKVIVPPAVLDETQYRADLADAQAIFAARQSGLLVVDQIADPFSKVPRTVDPAEVRRLVEDGWPDDIIRHREFIDILQGILQERRK